jgi:hypothetical protein
MSMENSMTRRRNRRHRKNGGLKALLFTASAIATIGGARLLELQEPVQVNNGYETIIITEPAANASANGLEEPGRKMTIELKPIPQVAVPHVSPVARAQSSM